MSLRRTQRRQQTSLSSGPDLRVDSFGSRPSWDAIRLPRWFIGSAASLAGVAGAAVLTSTQLDAFLSVNVATSSTVSQQPILLPGSPLALTFGVQHVCNAGGSCSSLADWFVGEMCSASTREASWRLPVIRALTISAVALNWSAFVTAACVLFWWSSLLRHLRRWPFVLLQALASLAVLCSATLFAFCFELFFAASIFCGVPFCEYAFAVGQSTLGTASAVLRQSSPSTLESGVEQAMRQHGPQCQQTWGLASILLVFGFAITSIVLLLITCANRAVRIAMAVGKTTPSDAQVVGPISTSNVDDAAVDSAGPGLIDVKPDTSSSRELIHNEGKTGYPQRYSRDTAVFAYDDDDEAEAAAQVEVDNGLASRDEAFDAAMEVVQIDHEPGELVGPLGKDTAGQALPAKLSHMAPRDWIFVDASGLYYSQSQRLYFDPASSQFYDPWAKRWFVHVKR